MHQSPFIFCVCVLLQWLLVTRSYCGLATSDTVPSSQLIVTHSATILGTNEPRNLRVLYRLFGPDTREYVFVSGTNHIYQFDAHNLQHLAARVIGPQNFSIFCSDEHDCSYCLIGPHETWPKGYSPNFCGPRPTDNFVKAWATSTVSENDVVRNSYTFVPVVINDDRIACEDALYVCYNVHHGYCERVRLHNVTKEAPWRTTHLDYADHPIPGRVPVVGCDPITHATIVVGARYVYTATEPDIQRLFTLSALDPLSVRSRDFYFVDSTPERKSVVSLDDPPIPLQYKASFRYRTRATFVPVSDPTVNVPPAHVYFVLQQPDHVSFIRWQPRVARICEGDKRFYSYVELNLACSDCVPLVDRDQKTLNALHTASRGQVGRNLARQLNASITHVIHRLHSLLPVSLSASRAVVNNSGLEDFHEVLLVAFAAQPVDPPMYWNTYDLQHGPQSVQYIRSSFFPNASDDQIGALLLAGSALSLFSMAHIDAQFNNVIRNCLEGHGTRGPSHFMRSTDREYIGCVHEAYLADEPYYCPTKPPMNRFITGETQEDSLRAPSFLYTTKNVTGVAITAVSADFTVCLITTDDGWLYKYEVTSVNDSRQLESKLLAPLGTPLTGISLDITGTVAFVTSLNKVFRVELSNCDAYHTCKACLEARDPYCGWCMSEGRCSRIDQCQIPSQPVMPYGNRAKHDQRKRRWDSPEVTQNNDYCANKFTPGYAMPSSTESWLPYTSPVSNCPTIRAIRPPGIQERRKAKSLEHSKDIQSSDSTGISTIVLHLEDSLVNDPRFRAFILNGSGLEKSSTDNFDSVNARHLVCAFRSAPDQWMQSESVLAGAWLPMSQMHSLLTNIRPGPVLTSTIARPILSANGSLEIHCDAPSLHQLPSLPARQASLPLVLWLDWFTPEKTKHNNRNENTQMKSAGHHASLVSGLFAIYDCARLADCRACSHSRFHCAWCLLEDRCVPSSWLSSTTAEQLCTRSTHLSELGTTNQEDAAPLIVSSGRSAECPRFTTDGQQITLMSGTPLSVTFHVYNVKRPLQHFTCEEGCNGQRVIPFYDPEKSLVICRNLTINVTEQLGNLQRHISNWSEDTTWSRTGINCSLNLYWHGHDSRNRAGHRMINEDNVKVEVYSCEMLAKHCDECLALPSRFGCGWCTSTLSGQSTTDAHVMCTTRAQCLTRKSLERVTSPAIRTKWLQSGSLCPNPQITSIYPLNGTLTGRPVLHVRGINLGRTVSDLVGHVQLDGPQPVACHVQTQAYFSSRAFTCQLDSAAHFTLPAHGRLKVVVSKYKYQAFSPVFHFLAPRLYEVHPERGPVAGGTRLKLHGSNLNIGANRTVWLLSVGPNADSQRVSLDDTLHRANTSVPCSVESETPELIVCRTGILPFNMSAVIASQRDSQPTANRVRKHVETNPSSQDAPIERGARSDVIKSNPVAPFMPMSLVLMHDLTPTFPIRPFTYLYSPNPQISTVRRQNVLASGGTTIRAEGDFLFVVEKPRVLIYYNGSEYISPCTYISRSLECLSPRLRTSLVTQPLAVADVIGINRNRSGSDQTVAFTNTGYVTHEDKLTEFSLDLTVHQPMISSQLLATVPDPLRPALLLAKTKQTVSQWPVDLVYGFIMDDVHSLRTYGILRVHSDPFVTPFPDGIRVEELDNLGIPPATDNTAEQNTHQKRHAPASDNPQSSRSTPGVEHPDQNRIESESKVHKLDNPSASVHQLLRLFGQFHTLVLAPELQAPDELIVRVGNSQRCLVTSVIDTEIRCDLDQSQLISTEDYPVEVQFGRFLIYRPGRVRFVRLGHTALRNNLVIGLTAVVVFLTLVALIAFAIWRRFNRHKRDYQVRLGQKYAEHESRVLRVFREDFMELQSNMQELSQEVKKHNLPYRDYRTFCLFSLFPEYHCELMIPVDPHTCGIHSTVETNRSGLSIDDSNQSVPTHPLLSPFIVPIESHDAASRGISLFNELICNHQFLCLCIRVLEEDERITARDKSRIASLLCAALQPKMVYLTRIMCDLMADMLKRLHNKGDNRLPTAFRRAESVVDKMVSNWLSFLLYNFIRNNVGENLFYFYRALLQQLNTGPRDAVTGKARYTLDSSTLLQTELTGKPINLLVVDPQALFSLPAEHMTVRVLDCDTISQAKEKILDAIYKNRPYSSQLKPVQLDLKRMNKPTGATVTSGPSFCHGQIMCDWEIEIQSDTNNHNIGKPPYRLNCIHDYGLIENERVALVVCEHDRIKPMPCTPAPSRVGHTFRSKKSQISSDLGNGSDHLTSPILGESTALSSEALTAKCRPGSSEINAPVSNSVDDYASPRAACSEVHEATYGTVHSPRLPSAHTLRPTGSPDPRLWCHLEYPGVTAGNGALRRSPELSLTRRGRIRKSLELKVTGTRCSHKTKCNCLRKADTTVGRDVSDTDSPRIGSWTSRSRSTRQPPSTTRMDVTGTGDAVVRRPLLDKSGEFQDSHIDKTASRSLRTRVIRSRKSRRCKSSQGSLKRNQTPVGFDRLMESLPKEVFFNRLVLTRLSVLKYMDKLFESIFSSVVQSQSVPSPIKYLFDFLDARAVGLGVQDPKTVHAWKSNCLQMRFWNQLITNLDYIFDIPLVRQTAFERSFHAFSQAMTYACAPTRDKVTSESSCVKVLFAQDIQNQWTRVQNYYREIKAMPEVKTEDMHELLEQHSKYHTNEFNVSWAIFELYTKYVKPCHDTLVAQLQQEALKLAYTYKSDPSLMFGPNKDYPLWNPMQMIDTLNDVKQCMNQAQFRMWPNPNSPSIVAGSTANGLNTHRSSPLVSRMPTLIMHGAQLYHPSAGNVNASLSTCPVYKFPNTNPTWTSSFGSPLGTGTGAQSSVQTNTDYPDTLRSFNTLTTEFAADEQASRNTLHPPPPPIPPNLIQPYHHHHHHHHHHCYDVYDPHGPIRNGHNFVQQPSESECSGLFSPSTPVAGTRPVGELHEQALGTTVGHDIGSECPAAEVHDPPAR